MEPGQSEHRRLRIQRILRGVEADLRQGSVGPPATPAACCHASVWKGANVANAARTKIGLFTVLTLLPVTLIGQSTVGSRGNAVVFGRAVEIDTRAPLFSSIVVLVRSADSSHVASVLTDVHGRFRLPSTSSGSFFVLISSLGYAAASTETFEVAAAEVRELGEIALRVEAVALEPITVSAQRSAVTFEPDRASYAIELMPGTAGASATELLGRIPELASDIDGRWRLGNNPVAIYVDGREAPISPDHLRAFLARFPAALLQEIEVIENPSARYRAAGTGGVINLVTREGVDLGVATSVSANAGTRGQYGISGRIDAQGRPWTINASGSLSFSNSTTDRHDLRQNLRVDPAFLRHDSQSESARVSTDANVKVRFEPSDGAQFSVEGRISGSVNDSRGLIITSHLDRLHAPVSVFDLARVSDGSDRSYYVSTGFSHSWAQDKHALKLTIALRRERQRQNARQKSTSEGDASDNLLIPAASTIEFEREAEEGLVVEASWTRRFPGSSQVEVGYQGDWTSGDNDRLVLEERSVGLLDGEVTEQRHEQRDRRQALYATVNKRMGAAAFEVGLRAEYARLNLDVADGGTFRTTYLNFFPGVSASYALTPGSRLRLSYSRRMQRPRVSELNPMNRSTDPSMRRVGNPDIKPELTHAASLDATWTVGMGTARLSPFYTLGRDTWSEMTSVDDVGIATRTYQNVGSRSSYGATLSYSVPERAGWRGTLSISGRREVRDARNLEARYSGSSLRVSARANVSGRVHRRISAEGHFSYDPSIDLPQGRIGARYGADFGVRSQLLQDRASVRLSVRDPFRLQRSSSTLVDQNYVLIGQSAESTRSVEVSLSYVLGGTEVRPRDR
jgi:outer membrane receptor protein involved in Fe transport